MVRTVHVHGIDLGCPKDSFLDLNDFNPIPLSSAERKRKRKEAEINLQQFKEKKIIEKVAPPKSEEIGEESEFIGEI